MTYHEKQKQIRNAMSGEIGGLPRSSPLQSRTSDLSNKINALPIACINPFWTVVDHSAIMAGHPKHSENAPNTGKTIGKMGEALALPGVIRTFVLNQSKILYQIMILRGALSSSRVIANVAIMKILLAIGSDYL